MSCQSQTHLDRTGHHLGHLGHPLKMLEQRGLGEVALGQEVLIHMVAQPPPGLLARAHVTRWGLCSSKDKHSWASASVSGGSSPVHEKEPELCSQTAAGTTPTLELWSLRVTLEKVAELHLLSLPPM